MLKIAVLVSGGGTNLQAILDSRDRKQAGPTAPPEGLCLMKVDY